MDFKYADDSIGGLESNVRIELRFAGETVADFRLSRTTTQSNRIAIRGDKGEVVLPIYDPSAVRIAIGGKVMNKKIASQSLRFADMVSEQLRDFAESIASGRPPLVTGADGMKVIEFIEQCYAAKRTRSLPGSAPIPGVVW